MNPTTNPSVRTMDDIPEALRESMTASHKSSSFLSVFRLWLGLGIAILALGGALIGWLWLRAPGPVSAISSTGPEASNDGRVASASGDPTSNSTDADSANSLLGHRPFAEAPPETLVPVTADGSIKLRQVAAEQLIRMLEKARADNIDLRLISGFRSQDEQEHLFFDIKAERGEPPRLRAEVSAPPGYSEHHTGYAIDFADGSSPETDLDISFEETPAFTWLTENAAYYGFEMSFPRDNPQGVSYEPWHWRFVGDRNSLETFYQAR